jgi:uncharacterized membrane protein YraQ (UPF0718 family)
VIALIIAYHWFDLNLILALIILTIMGVGILGIIVRKIKVNLTLSSLGQHPMGTDKAPLLKENFMNIQMRFVANTTHIDPDLKDPQFKKLFTSLYSIICNKVARNCSDVEIIKTQFVQIIFPVKPPKI